MTTELVLTHLVPIAVGFFAKLSAIKSQNASEHLELVTTLNVEKSKNIDSARIFSKDESVGAQWFRRSFIFVVLFFILIYLLAPFFGLDLVVQIDDMTSVFFGLIEFETTRFETIKGLFKFDEIFSWATLMVEFYFGGQLAKGR